MTPAELERYEFFNVTAKKRQLENSEIREYGELAELYAKKICQDNAAYLARRKQDMEEFLAEKAEGGERDFVKWLEAKGRV